MQIIDLVNDLRPTILAARQVQDARNTLARYLPYRAQQTVSYRLARRQRADQVAPIRAIDAPATPIRRPGVIDVRGDLPAITPIVDLSEQDLTNEMVIAQQLAGIPVDWTGPLSSAAGLAAATVDNTFEMLRGQALTDLGLALTSEDGKTYDVPFVDGNDHLFTVTTAWNATGGDALADFAAAHEQHEQRAGAPAGVALTTGRVRRTLLSALGVRYPNAPVDFNTLDAYLAANGLPPIETNDRRFTADDGTKTRVYAEGHLTFLPGDGPVGRTELGVTQEAVQQTQRIQPNGRTALSPSEAPGVTVVTLGRDNPVQRSVKAAAIGMPVVHEADQVTIVRGIFG